MLSRIGTGELFVIILVALFLVGPDRLPKLARSFGKAVAGFKHYMNDVTEELRETDADFKEVADDLKRAKKDINDTIKGAGSYVGKVLEDAGKEVPTPTAVVPAAEEVPKPDTEAPAEQADAETKAE